MKPAALKMWAVEDRYGLRAETVRQLEREARATYEELYGGFWQNAQEEWRRNNAHTIRVEVRPLPAGRGGKGRG